MNKEIRNTGQIPLSISIPQSDVRIIHHDAFPEILGKDEIGFHYDKEYIYLFDREKAIDVISRRFSFSKKEDRIKPIESEVKDSKKCSLNYEVFPPVHVHVFDYGNNIETAIFLYPIKRIVSIVKDDFNKEIDLLESIKKYEKAINIENLMIRAKGLLQGEIERIHSKSKVDYIS
jgi:hypothetical protein